MKILLGAALALLAVSVSAEEAYHARVKMALDGISGPLEKSSAATSTRYTSAYFNIDFIAPTGWAITKYDSASANSVYLTVSKAGRNNVIVFANRFSAASVAAYYGGWTCLSFAKTVDNSSASASLGFASDTTYPNGDSYSAIGLSFGQCPRYR